MSLILSGCWNMREIEHLIYINSIGVDYVDNKVVTYLQILSFTNIAKAEAGGQRQPQVISVGKGVGDSFDSAIFNLYPSATQRLAWSQVKSVVFTERAIKNGIVHEVLDEFDRYYELRYTVWAFATKERIEDIFDAKPILNISVLYSRLTDPQDMYRQNAILRPIQLYRFVSMINDKNRAVLLPYLSLTDKHWAENKKPLPELELDGVCILQNKKLKGCIPREQLPGLRWLERNTTRSAIPLKKGKLPIALVVLERPKAKITPTLKNGTPVFDVKINVSGYVTERASLIPLSEMETLTAKKIKEEVIKTFQTGLKHDADVLQLGHLFYKRQPHTWKKLSKDHTLPITEKSLASVDVQVKIVHGGLSKMK
ncbi:Ger(x)C family spore germination protein [Brevibacillus dissolubilis]|uniref:Ger(x)C family spore germination protein n=1 Tax=Brevibacillus dissolubilis TaxID=1844116 RepID=UPI00111726F4|nr:Ger(x)C family spore germination protein [Brevibacillus dissolubilis]